MTQRLSGSAKNLAIAAISAVGVLVLVMAGLAYVNRSPVPTEIRRQAPFAVFYPKGAEIKIKTETFKYSSDTQQVSFVTRFKGRDVTFAEQATPDQFNDIPDYYGKFTEKLQVYATFENTLAKVSLTRPVEVKKQVAVMNNKGVLLFAQAQTDMPEADWKQLFSRGVYEEPIR